MISYTRASYTYTHSGGPHRDRKGDEIPPPPLTLLSLEGIEALENVCSTYRVCVFNFQNGNTRRPVQGRTL